MNAADVLRMNVSDVLRMDLGELLHTDISHWRLPADDARLPAPALMRFEAEAGAAATARRFVIDVLSQWARAGVVEGDAIPDDAVVDLALIDRAELVVSEFVTRSTDLGSGGTVALRRRDDGVQVEVTADHADFDADDRSSLGVHVVDAASTTWGVLYTWPHYRALWSDITV